MAQNYPGKPPGWQPKGVPASAIPPTPPVAHSSGSGSGPKPKSVHPQPVGSGTPPASAGGGPKGKSPAAPKSGPAFPVRKGRKSDVFSFPWVIATILGLVLAYDILTYWKQASSIETTAFGAGTWAVKALEGNTNAGGNPSPTRTGRQSGA